MGDRRRFPVSAVRISLFLVLTLICLPVSAPAAGRFSKTLVLPLSSDPKTFNELLAQEVSTTEVTQFLFEGLTRLNTETGEVEGRLAASWETSPDGLSWTFYLRPDLHWSDGSPFTALDVVFTFRDLIYNPAVPNASRDIFTIKGEPMKVEAVDDTTVRFYLPSRFAPFPLAMAQSIYPEHILAPILKAGKFNSAWGTNTPPALLVGTGPFKLKEYRPGERVELVRNEFYWQKDPAGTSLPYLDRVILLVLPSADGRLLKFLSGETDYYSASGADFPLLKVREARGNFTLFNAGPSLGSSFLVFNQNARDPVKRSWFANREFRKAMALALDTRSIIDIVFNRLGVKQCSPVSPSTPFFYNPDAVCYDHDPEKAKQILAEQGFRDLNGDLQLDDPDGNPVEFVLLTSAEGQDSNKIAGMVREDLEELGIRVHFRAIDFNALVTKLVATHDWEAVMLGLTGSADPHFGSNVWRSEGSLHFWNPGQKAPATEWEKKINDIFDRALDELDRPARKKLYDEWQSVAAEEVPLIYTALPDTVFAVRNRFTNLRPTVLGGPFHNVEHIDIKKS